MNDYKAKTKSVIQSVINFLESSPWKSDYLSDAKDLLKKVDYEGTVAVAGCVKAGKSSLLNALLNDDLALVGTTETTATINMFLHIRKLEDRPFVQETPILCRRRDGRDYWIAKSELDSFQGNEHNEKMLEKSLEIDHFEFFLNNNFLERLVLVDTPGTGALVEEHQNATERYMRLAKDLRERHSEETVKLSDTADAVIYLVGPVAQVNDVEFLNAFATAVTGQARAYNAIGIMSMIDRDEKIIGQREFLAKSIAEKLSGQLNTVVPVSAGIARTLAKQPRETLAAMQEKIQKIDVSDLDFLLSDRELWLTFDCVLSADDRASLAEGMPWTVFTTIARRLHSLPLEEAIRELEDISGFTKLRTVIEAHFVARRHLLRCHQVINDLGKIVSTLAGPKMFLYREKVATLRRDFEDYCDFITSHPDRNSDVCNRLRRFLTDHMAKDESERLKNGLETLKEEIESIQADLKRCHDHFAALQKIEARPEYFSDEEKRELRNLFGMYADSDERKTKEEIATRELFWRRQPFDAQAERQDVAATATQAYALLLGQLYREQQS